MVFRLVRHSASQAAAEAAEAATIEGALEGTQAGILRGLARLGAPASALDLPRLDALTVAEAPAPLALAAEPAAKPRKTRR
jgi:hypothetical protein